MKKLRLLLAVLVVLSVLGGCSKSEPAPDPEQSVWDFTVAGKSFTLEGLKKMETISIELNKKGEVNSYKGVKLSLVLAEAGIGEFESLTLEAEDGYSFQITKEEALADDSILCYWMGGEDLSEEDNGPLMFASGSTSPQAWVGKLKEIRKGD